MARPGTQVISRTAAPPRSADTDTGKWFAAGLAPKGPYDRAVEITSLSEFEDVYGAREAYATTLYDSVDAFFREGGAVVVVGRVVGPTPVKATHTILDGSSGVVATATARTAGDWANGLKVVVDATGSTFTVVIQDANSVVLEDLGTFATAADLVAYSASELVTFVAGASSNDPVDQTVVLASGADDHAAAVDANWLTALNLFSKDLGPGQVSSPGRTTAAAQGQLLDHAEANNRVALLDLADTATKATLTAAAATLLALDNGRYGAAFAPWAVIPGITAGTTRTVPYSAIQAGLIARNDGFGVSPNQPAAGDLGVAQYATGLSQPAWSDSDREDLNDAGVTVAIVKFGQVRTYGLRTVSDEDAWVNFGNARLYMAIASEGDNIAERYVLHEVDGKGIVQAKLKGELMGMLVAFYEQGSLFGNTPEEAFYVDTGAQVNTTASLEAGELRAVVAVRMSPAAELVVLEIVKTSITQPVA